MYKRQRLLRAQKLEAVGRLAGGIAHDVNNVLATVRTNCELVLAKEMPRERLARRMETVVEAVLRASSLVERLLTFARRQPARPERVDLGEVIEGFERLALGSLSGQRLEIEREPGLWPVEIDLAQAEQALANLFFNARDATAAGGVIRLAARNLPGERGARDEVCLEVADTGSGIALEVQDQIFEPFFTTKAGLGSSGLGLATVYAVVEEAGGAIELDSQPGRGATFRLRFPRAAGAAERRPRPTDAPPAGRGERLLVVEDEGDLRGAVAALLETFGYRVTAVADPAAALAAARETGGFDLVVSDVRLAEGTGPALVARLRELGPVRALYLSGYTDRIALRGGGRGEAFFLKKPFSADGLARMVRELLDQPPAPRLEAAADAPRPAV